jgi:AcrR family transcriptional regulator
MSDQKRPYEKRKRAESEAETRLRITESAVALHGSLGPAHTSMSAVAEHAGVRRSTLYRHFPDEMALFGACSAHFEQANPPPDPGAWVEIGDPGERLRTALTELYAFYRRVEPMYSNLYRDLHMPTVAHYFGGFRHYLAAVADILLAGRGVRGRARTRVRAAIGHAVEFQTWRSLAREQGLDDDAAIELMRALVASARGRGRAAA